MAGFASRSPWAGSAPDTTKWNDIGKTMPDLTVAGPDLSNATQKTSFFGRGGTGRNIAGYIGDALSRMAGGPSIFQQAMMQKHEEEQRAQQGILAHQLALAQWQAQQDYERKTPKPFRFEANNGDQIEIGPDGPRTLYKDPTPKVDFIPVKNPDGTTTLYPRALGGAPQPQVLQQLPPGVKPYNGGAGQAAPRTFPVR